MSSSVGPWSGDLGSVELGSCDGDGNDATPEDA
jgi:hypothetical protein